MRISDWSSDVCSSDLRCAAPPPRAVRGDGDFLLRRRRGLDRQRAGQLPVDAAHRPGTDRTAGDDLRLDVLGRRAVRAAGGLGAAGRSEEHTSELQSLMRISYAVFCLKKKTHTKVKQLKEY